MERRLSNVDVSWFLDQRRHGQLELDPPYQRRSVWSIRDRRYFLDTIFRSYPSPAVFLFKRIDEAGRVIHDVVDGKQRLETIFLFVDNKLVMASDFGDSRLDGKKWRDLDDDLKKRLWDYVVPVEYIRVIEGNVVNEVFARLNRNSRKLEPQEIRHARNDGWFISFVEREAETDDFWRKFKISTTARARRMKDVQFISELLLILLEGKVIGFNQEALDFACAHYDVPDEENPDFDVEPANSRFAFIKDYISALDAVNGCVRKYASTLNHFYSLWGWITLNFDGLPEPQELATTYAAFMETVEALKNQSDHDAFVEANEGRKDLSLAHRYLLNAGGASTELPQREERHEVLSTVLPRLQRT